METHLFTGEAVELADPVSRVKRRRKARWAGHIDIVGGILYWVAINSKLRRRFTSSMFRSLPRLSTLLAHNTPAQQPASFPYFVARSTRGNLPVYSDIRNAGSRYFILIKNVDGNAKVRRDSCPSSTVPSDIAPGTRKGSERYFVQKRFARV